MATKQFFDSNILVYTDDLGAPGKQEVATNLVDNALSRGTGALSIQVLQEYFTATTRKLKTDLAAAREKVDLLGVLSVFQPQHSDVLAAIDLHYLHKLSFYDAMVLRAALQSGCRTLYSEDLQHGRRFDSLQVVNPFL